MTRKLRAVCWGELLWDRFVDADRLGGAAANVAYHARALGAETALVSCIGDDDLGVRALEVMRGHGVDVSQVRVDAQAPTGSVQVTLVDGQPRFAMSQTAAWDRIELTAPARQMVQNANVLFYGSLAQRTPLAQGALREALCIVGPLRVCDVNLRPPHVSRPAVELCLRSAHVVKMNEKERADLGELLGTPDIVAMLLDHGVRVVAVTLGARGAELHVPGATLHAAVATATPGGDPVGAGDAFSAVLGLSACLGHSPQRMLASANRYAAYVAAQQGAMPPTPDFAKELLAHPTHSLD